MLATLYLFELLIDHLFFGSKRNGTLDNFASGRFVTGQWKRCQKKDTNVTLGQFKQVSTQTKQYFILGLRNSFS